MTPPIDADGIGWSSSLGSVSLGSVAPASLRPDEKLRGLTARQFPRGGGMDPGIARPLAKKRFTFRQAMRESGCGD